MARLTSRTRVFFVGNATPVVPQFVLIDSAWNPGVAGAVQYAEALHPGKKYELILDDKGYRLVRLLP